MTRLRTLACLGFMTLALGSEAAWAQTFAGLVHGQQSAGLAETQTLEGGTFFGFHGNAKTSNGQAADLFTGQDNAYIHLDSNNNTALVYTLDLVDVSGTDPALPPRIADVMVGLGTTLSSDGGQRIDLIIGGGYSGLHAFTHQSGLYGMGTLMFSEQQPNGGRLTWMLDYNGNRPYLKHVPLPGVAVEQKWSDKSWGWLGYPYGKLHVDQEEGWQFDGEYDLGRLNAAGTWQMELDKDLWWYTTLGTKLIGGFDETLDGATRHFYRQHRIEIGVRSIQRFEGWFENAVPFLDVSIGGGYAFGQSFETGRSIDAAGPTVTLSNEPYLLLVIAGGF